MAEIKSTNFKDEYNLDEKNLLGAGAFAKVYKCTKISTGQDYAVKLVIRNLELPGSKKKEKSFDSELKINKRLHHENIVNLLCYFEKPKLYLEVRVL